MARWPLNSRRLCSLRHTCVVFATDQLKGLSKKKKRVHLKRGRPLRNGTEARRTWSVNNLSRNPITAFVSVSIIKRVGVGSGEYISLCDRLCREGTVEGLLDNHTHINSVAVTGGWEGKAQRDEKTKKKVKFYSDRYPDLARVCAEQMFKKQTLRTFSLRDSHNLQHGLCSFITACENTRIQVFLSSEGWRKSMFSLSTCSLYHAHTAKRSKCFWNPS